MENKSIIGLLGASFIAEAKKSAVTAPFEAIDVGKMEGENYA